MAAALMIVPILIARRRERESDRPKKVNRKQRRHENIKQLRRKTILRMKMKLRRVRRVDGCRKCNYKSKNSSIEENWGLPHPLMMKRLEI